MKLKPILCLVSAAACCTISFTACRNVTNPGDNSSSATTDMNETTDTKTTEISKPTASETTLASSQKQQSEPTAEKRTAVAKCAESLVGKSYKYGATGPDAFDNSGLLVYCFAQNGLTLPRKTGDIAQKGSAVEKKDLMPGDAVFFYNENPGAVEYAGIYIGDGRFVASNDEDSPVSIHSLNTSYFESRFLFARRFFG